MWNNDFRGLEKENVGKLQSRQTLLSDFLGWNPGSAAQQYDLGQYT